MSVSISVLVAIEVIFQKLNLATLFFLVAYAFLFVKVLGFNHIVHLNESFSRQTFLKRFKRIALFLW